MPIRYLPDLALSRDVPQSPTNRVKCLIYNTRIARRDRGATSLGHVRLPAAVPAEGPRRGTHQGTRRQAKVPARAMVYQMPARPYPLDSGIGRMGVYAHFRPYLTTHGLRWSYPALTEAQRNWEDEIARVELVNLPRHLAGLGFSLISINRGAYADDGQHLRDELTRGGATFVAENWEYLVMDLRPVGGPK